MGKFKVKVDTPEESKEVQELLVKMGYHARANWSERNPIHDSIQAWPDGEFTFSLNHDRVPVGFKGITLPELRAMVKPMKEYLDKQEDGTYKLISASGGCVDRDWIEVPEGAIRARFYPNDPEGLEFENAFCQWWDNESNEWIDYDDYKNSLKHSRVVWQRSETEYLMQGKNGDKLMESVAELKNQETVKVTIDELKNRVGVDDTLAERQSQYGSFKDVADTTAVFMGQFELDRMSSVQREALHMICSKLARIANGDPNHVDSWHDIAGYATLVVDDLES